MTLAIGESCRLHYGLMTTSDGRTQTIERWSWSEPPFLCEALAVLMQRKCWAIIASLPRISGLDTQ